MAVQEEEKIDDDEVGDNWEDIEEEDLLRRLTTRQQEISKLTAKQTPPTSTEMPLLEGPTKIKYSEGSEYVAQIKILKRPDNDTNDASVIPTPTERSQKSLAQREAEYASARARILGNPSTNKTSADKKLMQRNSNK